ncbi:MAG: pyrroline-5-carboxylate reductase [Planctomycetota bacterium]
MRYDLAFIGAGNMAEAIVRSAVSAGVVDAGRVLAVDLSEQRRAVFAEMGCTVSDAIDGGVGEAEQAVLSVKPQVFGAVADRLAEVLRVGQVVVSIMAGLSTAKISDTLGGHAKVVRVMPNTPVMVGQGMAGIALGEHAEPGDDAVAMRLFEAGGRAVRVSESLMDAVTAVSGSGPAYVFYLAEAMMAAAEKLGLGEHADVLVRQTILGAAELLSQSDASATELRRRVTSPGGTTEAAIDALSAAGFVDGVIDAIRRAEARGQELGED